MFPQLLTALALLPLGAAYPAPIHPCNSELTSSSIFIGAPFLPAAIGLKAAASGDARVTHLDDTHWEWNYHTRTRDVLPNSQDGKPGVIHIACHAVDAHARLVWVVNGGGEDVPAAALICILNNKFKNQGRLLFLALSAELEVLAAKQLWRDDEGTLLCHLPRQPPGG